MGQNKTSDKMCKCHLTRGNILLLSLHVQSDVSGDEQVPEKCHAAAHVHQNEPRQRYKHGTYIQFAIDQHLDAPADSFEHSHLQDMASQ